MWIFPMCGTHLVVIGSNPGTGQKVIDSNLTEDQQRFDMRCIPKGFGKGTGKDGGKVWRFRALTRYKEGS